MRRSTLSSLFFLLAATGLFSAARGATVTATQGQDLIMGFRATGGTGATVNLEINLGAISKYYPSPASSSFVVTALAKADLDAAYGSGWNTRTDLFWGIVGYTGGGNKTLFAGQAESIGGAKSAPYQRDFQNQLNASGTVIQSTINGLNNQTATANSTAAALVLATDGASWTAALSPDGGTSFDRFPTAGVFENGTKIASGYYAVTDLWRIQAGSGDAVYVGSFGLSSSGVLTFSTDPSLFAVAAPPTISAQPTDQSAIAGGSATFTVTASGTPAPSYQWKRGSTVLTDGGSVSGATSESLALTNIQAGDAGSYTVVVSNSNGSVTSSAATLTVSVPPTFTTQPVGQTVNPGTTVTFTGAATGSPTPTLQWRKNGTDITGATTGTLTLTSVTASDAATYTLAATNPGGTTVSSAAVLTVKTPPAIGTAPTGQAAFYGDTFSLTVVATGSAPLTYQWRKGQVNLSDGGSVSGATTATLTLTSVTYADAGSYDVVISNGALPDATSAAVTVSVSPVAPGIASQPTAQSANDGGGAIFSVTATGTAPLTYQWQKNGTDISGATGATLALSNLTLADSGGAYRVIVTNLGGSLTSNPAVLTVNPVAPSITTQPVNRTVSDGGSTTFTVVATGTAPLGYQWKKDSVNLPGENSATLALNNLGVAVSGGVYTVVVSNSAGSVTSAAATLTVNAIAPSITTQPGAQSTTDGGTASFTVVATGTAPLTYQWRKNGNAISGATAATLALTSVPIADSGAVYSVVVTNAGGSVTSAGATLTVAAAAPTITVQPANQGALVGGSVTLRVTAAGTGPLSYQWKKGGTDRPGATSATLTLSNLQVADAGSYTVVVSNSAGAVTSAAATVEVAVEDSAPQITTQPSGQTAAAGATATLSVLATGVPTPTFQWYKGSSPIAGATEATLTLANVQPGDEADYHVVATNSKGSDTSATAHLTVQVGPVFTTQPSDQAVSQGTTATFTVAASGTPAPTFAWFKNNVAIPGATGATLTLANVQPGDAADYTAVATNAVNSVTSTKAVLTVNTRPVFTTQPAGQTVNRGLNVTFIAVASGQPAPTYQWRKDGTAISGATESTLTLTNTQPADAGAYSVVAINSAGSATSADAVLAVNLAAAIVTQPASQTVTAGKPVSFTVVASGTPAPTYQWSKGGVAIPGATAATYTIATVQAADAGTYTVSVVNTLGAVTSAGAVLTVNVPPVITTQPASQTVTAGANVTLTVVATGTPAPTYQWQKNGADLTGATAATLTLTSVQSAAAGSYTVVVTNAGGSVTSNAAVLTVNSGPAFDVQPSSQSTSLGTTITFTASSSVTPAPTYQWQVSSDAGKKWTNLFNGGFYSGVTTTVLTISSVTSALDGYQYRSIATNSLGTSTSNVATLVTNKQPATVTLSGLTTVFNDSRQSAIATTVPAGLSVAITYDGSGTPPYSAGIYNVVASINDPVYGGSASATMVISPVTPTVTWNTPAPLSYAYQLSGRELNATASVPGKFVYQPGVGTSLPLGSHTLSAMFQPTDSRNYATVPISTVILVVKGQLTATANNQTRIYGADNPPLTITYTGFAGGETKTALTTEPTATTTATKESLPGTYPITLSGGYANNYDLKLVGGTLTILARDFSGYYFGNLAGGGTWALRVRADGTGTYIAYLPDRHSAIVTPVTLDSSGAFGATGSEAVPQAVTGTASALSLDAGGARASAAASSYTLSGRVVGNTVSAQIPEFGLTFTGALDAGSGSFAGLYTAATLATAGGTTNAIVGPSGQAVVVVTTPTLVSGAAGTVGAGGEFGATAGDGTVIAAAFSLVSQSMAAAVTPVGATTPINFSGSADAVPQTAHLVNLSVRTGASSGDKTLIVGFVVGGTGAKPLLVRAIGPSLQQFGITNPLFDPKLAVSSAGATPVLVASNDDWDPSVKTITSQLGAFPLAAGSLDAALYSSTRFTSGPFTMQVIDSVGASGLALAEVYDALPGSRTARLVNVSARAQVESGDGVLIAGFVISGTGSMKVLIRGVGPTLTQYGVKAPLANPQLDLYQSIDGKATKLAGNDDWGGGAVLSASFATTGAFTLPKDSKDAVLLVTLSPGVYSAQLSGVAGQTGVALVEVYEVP